MPAFAEGNEFYADYKGYELKVFLPDIPIRCLPVVDTSTHRLAIETNPQWGLRVRHRGCWRTKTRPKVSVYAVGQTDKIGFSFALPSRSLYTSMTQVVDDLRRADYSLKARSVQLLGVLPPTPDLSKLDELQVMEFFNARRADELRKRLPPRKPVPTAEVFSLEDWLRRREPADVADAKTA